jgi:hypothetical protein
MKVFGYDGGVPSIRTGMMRVVFAKTPQHTMQLKASKIGGTRSSISS